MNMHYYGRKKESSFLREILMTDAGQLKVSRILRFSRYMFCSEKELLSSLNKSVPSGNVFIGYDNVIFIKY